jgi:hypothetical protein
MKILYVLIFIVAVLFAILYAQSISRTHSAVGGGDIGSRDIGSRDIGSRDIESIGSKKDKRHSVVKRQPSRHGTALAAPNKRSVRFNPIAHKRIIDSDAAVNDVSGIIKEYTVRI